MNSIAQQQDTQATTTTPPASGDWPTKKHLDAWIANVGGNVEEAAEDVALLIASNAGAIEGEVDVDQRLASANNALHCALRELRQFGSALSCGIVPGVGKSPAAAVMQRESGVHPVASPPAPDVASALAEMKDARHPSERICDVRGILHEAIDYCGGALMALVAHEAGYSAEEQVTKALNSVTSAERDLSHIEIDCGHVGSPFAPETAPESGTQPAAERARVDGAAAICDVADTAMLALQHALAGLDGGICDNVFPDLRKVARSLRTIRGCALNIRAAVQGGAS